MLASDSCDKITIAKNLSAVSVLSYLLYVRPTAILPVQSLLLGVGDDGRPKVTHKLSYGGQFGSDVGQLSVYTASLGCG